jgi:NAD+ kinase
MRVAVNGRAMEAHQAATVHDLLRRMTAAGLDVSLTPTLASWFREGNWPVLQDRDPAAQGIDLCIGLGGDGTLLDTVGWVGRSDVPVLGITLGRLGFLANVRLEEVDQALAALGQRRYTLQERSMVEVIGQEAALGPANFALNEVSVHKRDTSSMIAVHVHLGTTYLYTYWADGLIIATPTGSTAYSLSCGGPVLHPTSDALVITPISAHNLNVRPFVVPDRFTVELQVEARADKCLLNLDTRSVSIDGDSRLSIRKAPFTLKMVELEGQDFLTTLREKLNWGLDLRSGLSGRGEGA